MPDRSRMAQRQQVLADFGEFSLRSDSLDAVLTEACRLVADALGTGRAKVLEIAEDGGSLVVRAGVGWSDGVVGQIRLAMSDPTSESYSVALGEPVITNDLGTEHRFVLPDFLRDAGVQALANVPIYLPGRRPYGLLQVDAQEPRTFGDDDIQFLRTYATILGPVIDRLHLVTVNRATEKRLADDLAAMQELQRVSADLVGQHSPGVLYDRVVAAAATLMRSDAASLHLYDPDSETLSLGAASGFHPEAAGFWEPTRVDPATATGQALQAGLRSIVVDVDHAPIRPDERHAYQMSGLRSVQSTPLKAFSGQVVGMLSTYWRDRSEPTQRDLGFFDLLARLTADLIERVQADERLRESETRLRGFGEASQDVLWIRDADTLVWTYLTPAFMKIYGMNRAEALSGDNWRNWTHMILPEDRAHAIESIDRIRSGENVTFEYRIQRASDGQIRWMRDTDFPILDSTGRLTSIGGIGTDFTAEKEAAQRMKVLVAELQHRTRNLISVVRAVADRTAASASSLDAFRDSFRARLGALARVNGLLSRLEERDRISFDELIRTELAGHGVVTGADVDAHVTLDGPSGIRLRSSTVQTFALALHELATNAVKYGALANPAGHLIVEWRLLAGDEPRLRVEWRETGVAIDVGAGEAARVGYGRELIERALPFQLQAETDYELRADGVRCVIILPISTRHEEVDDA